MQENQRNELVNNDHKHEENHRKGKELYQRDQDRSQQQQPRQEGQRWDAGNNFHTGYSNQNRSHFPEDNQRRASNIDGSGDIHRHYGERDYSVYRNPNSLNYGDGRGDRNNQQNHQPFQQGNQSNFGDGRGNYNARRDSDGQGYNRVHSERINPQRYQDDTNEKYYRGGYMDSRGVNQELPRPDSSPYDEYPGSRSRYKDDDYRYGSGNHTWYQEHRYTANDGRDMDRDRGSIFNDMGEGARELWNDVKGGVQNLWNRNDNHSDDHNYNHNNGYRNENGYRNNNEYRSPREDRGYERGPRWSDESDSGDDRRRY